MLRLTGRTDYGWIPACRTLVQIHDHLRQELAQLRDAVRAVVDDALSREAIAGVLADLDAALVAMVADSSARERLRYAVDAH